MSVYVTRAAIQKVLEANSGLDRVAPEDAETNKFRNYLLSKREISRREDGKLQMDREDGSHGLPTGMANSIPGLLQQMLALGGTSNSTSSSSSSSGADRGDEGGESRGPRTEDGLGKRVTVDDDAWGESSSGADRGDGGEESKGPRNGDGLGKKGSVEDDAWDEISSVLSKVQSHRPVSQEDAKQGFESMMKMSVIDMNRLLVAIAYAPSIPRSMHMADIEKMIMKMELIPKFLDGWNHSAANIAADVLFHAIGAKPGMNLPSWLQNAYALYLTRVPGGILAVNTSDIPSEKARPLIMKRKALFLDKTPCNAVYHVLARVVNMTSVEKTQELIKPSNFKPSPSQR